MPSQQNKRAPTPVSFDGRGLAKDARVAGLADFHRRRKHDNGDRLLAAAMSIFCERGYLRASVDDIARAAGVSRMTFYRHFGGKTDIAVELFRTTAETMIPHYLRISGMDFAERPAVVEWIAALFDVDRANRRMLRAFNQATADEGNFTERAQELIATLIVKLGSDIPAFALPAGQPEYRRRWLEAWLLLYEILDQSNHAALGSGAATDPIVIEILADRFLAFVTGRR